MSAVSAVSAACSREILPNNSFCRQTAGYLRTFEKNNKLPNNEMIGRELRELTAALGS